MRDAVASAFRDTWFSCGGAGRNSPGASAATRARAVRSPSSRVTSTPRRARAGSHARANGHSRVIPGTVTRVRRWTRRWEAPRMRCARWRCPARNARAEGANALAANAPPVVRKKTLDARVARHASSRRPAPTNVELGDVLPEKDRRTTREHQHPPRSSLVTGPVIPRDASGSALRRSSSRPPPQVPKARPRTGPRPPSSKNAKKGGKLRAGCVHRLINFRTRAARR